MRNNAMTDGLERVTMTLCARCLDGGGGECHTSGCALRMNDAPDINLRERIEDQGCVLTALIDELVAKVERLTAENNHLRSACEKLCCVAWSGHNCVACGLPTAETEYVVGFGVCTRCMDKDLNEDRWKAFRRKVEALKPGGAAGESLREIYNEVLNLIDQK